MTRTCYRILPLVLLTASVAGAQTITVASYNVERFAERFEGHHASTQPIAKDPAVKQIISDMQKDNDKSNWEAAEVIRQINPDILVIIEGPEQEDLDYFNRRWMDGFFKTDIVFPTNTTRHQTLCMLLRPGFKVVQKRDQYYLENDTVPNPRGERLFARGPAFCLIETPSGYRFWVGVTHQKSKANLTAGRSAAEVREERIDFTRWRNREAVRTHAIMKELEHQGPSDVILLGDMNDALGTDDIDAAAGGDTIAMLVGPPQDGFILETRLLAERHEISFHGYWNPKYRSFIDHIVVTPEMKDRVSDVHIFREGLAPVASDHYPVVAKIRTDNPPATAPAN